MSFIALHYCTILAIHSVPKFEEVRKSEPRHGVPGSGAGTLENTNRKPITKIGPNRNARSIYPFQMRA
jgi:hypothetical protein